MVFWGMRRIVAIVEIDRVLLMIDSFGMIDKEEEFEVLCEVKK